MTAPTWYAGIIFTGSDLAPAYASKQPSSGWESRLFITARHKSVFTETSPFSNIKYFIFNIKYLTSVLAVWQFYFKDTSAMCLDEMSGLCYFLSLFLSRFQSWIRTGKCVLGWFFCLRSGSALGELIVWLWSDFKNPAWVGGQLLNGVTWSRPHKSVALYVEEEMTGLFLKWRKKTSEHRVKHYFVFFSAVFFVLFLKIKLK